MQLSHKVEFSCVRVETQKYLTCLHTLSILMPMNNYCDIMLLVILFCNVHLNHVMMRHALHVIPVGACCTKPLSLCLVLQTCMTVSVLHNRSHIYMDLAFPVHSEIKINVAC